MGGTEVQTRVAPLANGNFGGSGLQPLLAALAFTPLRGYSAASPLVAAPAPYALDRPTRLRLVNGRPLERRFPAPVAVLAWPGLLRPRALIRAHATYSMQHAACCMRLDYSLLGGGLPAPVPVWAISSVPVLLG